MESYFAGIFHVKVGFIPLLYLPNLFARSHFLVNNSIFFSFYRAQGSLDFGQFGGVNAGANVGLPDQNNFLSTVLIGVGLLTLGKKKSKTTILVPFCMKFDIFPKNYSQF